MDTLPETMAAALRAVAKNTSDERSRAITAERYERKYGQKFHQKKFLILLYNS